MMCRMVLVGMMLWIRQMMMLLMWREVLLMRRRMGLLWQRLARCRRGINTKWVGVPVEPLVLCSRHIPQGLSCCSVKKVRPVLSPAPVLPPSML